MKFSRQYVLLLFISCTLCVTSCKEEATIQQQEIYGNWEVIAAKRDNRLTSTLTDGYFIFQETGSMKTNIFGVDASYTIDVQDNTVVQTGDQSAEYKIRMLRNDTLHMSAIIQKRYFDFLAVKRDTLKNDLE